MSNLFFRCSACLVACLPYLAGLAISVLALGMDGSGQSTVTVTAPTTTKFVNSTFTIPISFDDGGGNSVIAHQFNIIYDPGVIDPIGPNFGCSNSDTIAGAAGHTVDCNITDDPVGALRTLRVSNYGSTPTTGSGVLLNINFQVNPTAVSGNRSPLDIQDLIVYDNAGELQSIAVDGEVSIVAPPTAAGVTVSGRVADSRGRPISSVRVRLTDADGFSRQAFSNRLGFYLINGVPAGEDYVISARSRRYKFAPRMISVTDDLSGVDLVAR